LSWTAALSPYIEHVFESFVRWASSRRASLSRGCWTLSRTAALSPYIEPIFEIFGCWASSRLVCRWLAFDAPCISPYRHGDTMCLCGYSRLYISQSIAESIGATMCIRAACQKSITWSS
jgi:hypothetical protein